MPADLRALCDEARDLDQSDPAPLRDRFEYPLADSGGQAAYFAGNSLGLLPSSARAAVDMVMSGWSSRAVEGHFAGEGSWSDLVESLSAPTARLLGALPHEVVAANTLTVNMHLLLLAFYRPVGTRTLVLTERDPFPSDGYAVVNHPQLHGLTAEAVVYVDADEHANLSTAAIVEAIAQHGEALSCVLLPGIRFRTGQLLDIATITAAAHRVGDRKSVV